MLPYLDVLFLAAFLTLGLGLSLATYRIFAVRNDWPMGELHANKPLVPILLGVFAIAIAVLFAGDRQSARRQRVRRLVDLHLWIGVCVLLDRHDAGGLADFPVPGAPGDPDPGHAVDRHSHAGGLGTGPWSVLSIRSAAVAPKPGLRSWHCLSTGRRILQLQKRRPLVIPACKRAPSALGDFTERLTHVARWTAGLV